jgi:hypothetical protein
MRIIGMEKEKRKGSPKRRRIAIGILTVILLMAGGCWAWSYYISPGHSLSDFSRFKSEEEVVAFLHEHFDLNVTTSDDIRTFMAAHPLEYHGCQDWTPTANDYANNIVDEEVTKIIFCDVPYWGSIVGTFGYVLRFYMNTDDLLVYISAGWSCACL